MEERDILEKLLSGEITSEELGENNNLITLAERIYGREVLDELGISKSERGSQELQMGIDGADVSLPDIGEEYFRDPEKKRGNGYPEEEGFLSNSRFSKMVLFAIVIRLILAPFTSDSHDMTSHVLGVLDMIDGGSPYDGFHYPYPPLVMIIYYPIFLFLSIFSDPSGWYTYSVELAELSLDVPLLEPIVTSPVFNLVWKLPLIGADLVSAYAIYRIGLILNRGHRESKFFAGCWILNPLSIYTSSVSGQIDGMMVMFLLISIWKLIEGKTMASGMLFALACSVKGYVLPLFLVFLAYSGTITSFSYSKWPKSFDKIPEKIRGASEFSITTLIVGFCFLLPMLLFEGDTVLVRRIGAPSRYGGIHPVSIRNLHLSGVFGVLTNDPQGAMTSIENFLVSFQPVLRFDFSLGIIIALFVYFKSEQGWGASAFLKGIAAHCYVIIFLALGAVNSQFMMVLLPLIILCYVAGDYSSKNKGGFPVILAGLSCAIYSLSIVSFLYTVIPVSYTFGLPSFEFLAIVLDRDWNGDAVLSNSLHQSRWGIYGPVAWIFVTYAFIDGITQTKGVESVG